MDQDARSTEVPLPSANSTASVLSEHPDGLESCVSILKPLTFGLSALFAFLWAVATNADMNLQVDCCSVQSLSEGQISTHIFPLRSLDSVRPEATFGVMRQRGIRTMIIGSSNCQQRARQIDLRSLQCILLLSRVSSGMTAGAHTTSIRRLESSTSTSSCEVMRSVT